MSDTQLEFDEDLIGRVLQDRFEIVQPIGGGGMGAVYLGRQLSVDRNVAVKVLREGLPENAKSRFMREARTVSEMSHPGIVQMIDFGTEGELCFLVMELVDGIPLDVLLAKGRLHPALALLITDQVAAALAEAHARGVIHRDLKPGNILLTVTAGGEPQAKLLDFGIAYSETDPRLTQSGTLCGTPAYMAPEQAQGRAVVPATDFYALGVNLYEMLSGRLPFYAESPVGVLLKHLQQKPPTLRAHVEVGVLPFGAVRLAERLLKKEVGNRPESARDVRKMVADARAQFDAPPLILEGKPAVAFDPLVFPELSENPNQDVANSRGISFLDASAFDGTTDEKKVELADIEPRPDTQEDVPADRLRASGPAQAGFQEGAVPGGTSSHSPTSESALPDSSGGSRVSGAKDNAGARAWAAFTEASESTTGQTNPRDPARIDPNLWAAPTDDHMASFSDNSIEFQVPTDFFTIEPHDTQTRERPRVAFQDHAEPQKHEPSAGKVSREEKRPDWLQSAQESMEYEIEPMLRSKPNLPPEPEDLPELPPEETGETKFMSNILFILLTIGLVSGMAFIGMELFVKPAKQKADPATVGEPDRFPPTHIRRKDDPDRRIGSPSQEAGQTESESTMDGMDDKKRKQMKERLNSIDDIRYRAPIEILESDGVKKGTEDIQDL